MKTAVHYQIRHGLLLSCRTGINNGGGPVIPSAGVYYVVKYHDDWMVMAYRYEDVEEEMDHTGFWERFVAPLLSRSCPLKMLFQQTQLVEALKEHSYGFPRGRVAWVDGLYHVYHGPDLADAPGIKRKTIETIFGIKGTAKWIKDDHEHCLETDKEAVREFLALEEDWKAV